MDSTAIQRRHVRTFRRHRVGQRTFFPRLGETATTNDVIGHSPISPLLVAVRHNAEDQASDRDSGTVIDPAGLIDHEALSRVREITRALRYEALWSEQVASEVVVFVAIGPSLLRRIAPIHAMRIAAL